MSHKLKTFLKYVFQLEIFHVGRVICQTKQNYFPSQFTITSLKKKKNQLVTVHLKMSSFVIVFLMQKLKMQVRLNKGQRERIDILTSLSYSSFSSYHPFTSPSLTSQRPAIFILLTSCHRGCSLFPLVARGFGRNKNNTQPLTWVCSLSACHC